MRAKSETGARTTILRSIREHLAESVSRHAATEEAKAPPSRRQGLLTGEQAAVSENGYKSQARLSPVEMFREHLEAVGGHCLIVTGEDETARALSGILAELQRTLAVRRIALSDAPLLARLTCGLEVDLDELRVAPSAAELFDYDVGVTTAQTAIAETGTLVLESDSEHHRLVSLLPPVHIAIVDAKDICLTIRDALKHLRRCEASDISRTVTFITGPSRTADIELTLTVGVHGPKELYVIVST